jgi:hypothetical protein
MDVEKLAPGFWRWTAPHPDWKDDPSDPLGGWDETVGCVYLEADDAVVLIDPLAPPDGTEDGERFWHALDRDVERAARPVAIVLTLPWHERSTVTVRDRYGAAVWMPARYSGRDHLRASRYAEGDELPGGLTALAVTGQAAEQLLYVPLHRGLVVGDAILGTGEGGLVVNPLGWLDEATPEELAGFVPSLRSLLELEVETVVPSHGPPVLADGREALRAALDHAPSAA